MTVFIFISKHRKYICPTNIDPVDVRYELLLSGFFMKITNGPQIHNKPMKVGIMHNEVMSKIPLNIQKKDIFFLAVNGGAYRLLKHAFKLFIPTRVMKFESLSRISFPDQIGINHVRGRISKLGYYGEIFYDPLETLHEMGEKVLGKHGCSLIIMDNLEDAELREEMLDIWIGFEVEALMNSSLIDTMLDKEFSLGDAVRTYLKNVFKLTMRSTRYGRAPVFRGFPGFDNIAEFDADGYLNALWSVMYDTI